MFILIALAVLSVILVVQSAARLYLMLYGWNKRTPGRPQGTVPLAEPHHSFSVLLPAWQESEVIAATIDRVAAIDYPASLFEMLVICDQSDTPTIEAAQAALDRHPNIDGEVVLLTHGPRSKATGLNRGLEASKHEVIVIVDAEDDVQPGILSAANSAYSALAVDIVQGPVQLINQGSRWYSQLNCLEYYFWFHSRLIFHAESNVIPLAGNTVFFRREALDALGGWDVHSLTEDADVGIRASVLGYKTAILADPQLATREETPEDLGGLLRQRTRWHQGFLQILRKGDWFKLPTWRGRGIALTTLGFPLYAALTSLIWPLSIPLFFLVHGPVWLVLLAAVPYYLLIAQMLFSAFGLTALRQQFQLKLGVKQILFFTIGFLPYQWMIGLCGIRAMYREARGFGGWEKTAHVGSHRPAIPAATNGALAPALASLPANGSNGHSAVPVPVAGGSNGHPTPASGTNGKRRKGKAAPIAAPAAASQNGHHDVGTAIPAAYRKNGTTRAQPAPAAATNGHGATVASEAEAVGVRGNNGHSSSELVNGNGGPRPTAEAPDTHANGLISLLAALPAKNGSGSVPNESEHDRARRIANIVEFLGAVNEAGTENLAYLTQLTDFSSPRPNGGTPNEEDAFLTRGDQSKRNVPAPNDEEE